MSRRTYEPNRLYGDLTKDDRNDDKPSSSVKRSRWDESPKGNRREEEKAGRYYDKIVNGERSGSRSEHKAEQDRYDDRRSRDRRRSNSPSSSSAQFAHDREKERRAYDRRYEKEVEKSTISSSIKDTSQPDFGSSGLLAKESNQKNGTQLKYFEPPEARKPKKKWRLYVFKDAKEVDIIHISNQSCYLIGRDENVVDVHVEHPSISKQHCVIQFRKLTERNEFGDEKRQIKPFLIDLDSANGSFVNKTEIPPSRYYELRNGDTIKLGASQREYVLLAEDQ